MEDRLHPVLRITADILTMAAVKTEIYSGAKQSGSTKCVVVTS